MSKVELNREVYLDLLEIMEYYDAEVGGTAANDFYAEFRFYVDQAAKRPASFPKISDQHLRANLNRFPYHFLFRRIDRETIRILVVRHNRRHPGYGIERN